MRKSYKYILLNAAGLLIAGSLASCSETDAEKDRGSAPVIKYARMCDSDKADSLVVSARLGTRLAFVGDNLGDVQQVWFNDQKAKLNPTMVTSHTIIVDIPNLIPAEVNNTARFITSTGMEVNYPFNVIVPAPRIDNMSCEYAKAGETVTFKGAYFADDPNVPFTVTFPGGIPAEIKSLSEEEVSVVVPDGAVEGPVTMTSIYGEGSSSFRYMDTRGMLFDFDSPTDFGSNGQWWHAPTFMTDDSSISGKYMMLNANKVTMSADGGWDDSNFAFEYWPGAWTDPVTYPAGIGDRLFDIADFSDFNNKCLKFEINIPAENPWQAGAMQFIFAGTDKISFGNAGLDEFGNNVAGCNNTYFQGDNEGLARGLWIPWSDTEAYHTNGEWVTVSFPIKDFVYGHNGTGADKFLGSKEDFASLMIFVVAGGKTGVDCQPVFKFDNIRVVPN